LVCLLVGFAAGYLVSWLVS